MSSDNPVEPVVRRSGVWGVLYPDGRIFIDSDFDSAEEAIDIALGWPSQIEILEAMKKGLKVLQFHVRG